MQNVLWAKRLYWVIDLDIQKYFDSIRHSHLRAFLDQRVTDGVIRRMIDKWLNAVTLEWDWAPEEVLPLPKKPQKLPIVLGPEEVLRFLGCVLDVKHHAILTTCYAAGLRISEAVQLKPTAIDSQRMVIRAEGCKS